MPTIGRRVLMWFVMPALGLPLSIGVVALVMGPLSWYSLYGSWSSESEMVGDAIFALLAVVVGLALWVVVWFATAGRTPRVRSAVLAVALLVMPTIYSVSNYFQARSRWCQIRSVNGPDPRLHTLPGFLAPHCTAQDRIDEMNALR